jgi:catechol 2,3-dioxygenase-like lactoylglutathione lyase family enzyme
MRKYVRDIAFLMAGSVIALIYMRPSQAQDDRLTGMRMNHVGIVAKDWQTTLDFYIKTLGFREAFTFKDNDGKVTTSYIQMSKEDFLEIIRPTAQNTPGVNHVGIWVDDIQATVAKLRKKGVKVEDIRVGNSKAPLTNFSDPNGVRIELLQYPPESWQKQAMDSWK